MGLHLGSWRTDDLREVVGSLHQLCAVPAQLAGVALVEAQPCAVGALLGRQLHAMQAALDEVLCDTESSVRHLFKMRAQPGHIGAGPGPYES